jgi:pyruvate ferredoxin oxidoreductase gamma subunit
MSIAAFHSGKHALSFPSFGSERMGAPVAAFVRIDEHEIELREPVMRPDLLIVLDPTLFQGVEVFAGLSKQGWVLINSRKTPDELGLTDVVARLPDGHVVCVPGTELAIKHLKLPKPNLVLVGATCALLPSLFTRSAFEQAILEFFHGRVGEMNIAAAREAIEMVRGSRSDRVEAGTC